MSGDARWRERQRAKWQYRGEQRPSFAAAPALGQESVWDYPRPPRVERDPRRVEVRAGGVDLADSVRALRVLETASPPTFYLPSEDARLDLLVRVDGASECEWKGGAVYWALRGPEVSGGPGSEPVAWSYPSPLAGFEELADHLAFYPGRVECHVAGERVRAQPGGFYGGWITSEIAGPAKGEPGTESW
jgi:uncharacterized protein (DUF427 family)